MNYKQLIEKKIEQECNEVHKIIIAMGDKESSSPKTESYLGIFYTYKALQKKFKLIPLDISGILAYPPCEKDKIPQYLNTTNIYLNIIYSELVEMADYKKLRRKSASPDMLNGLTIALNHIGDFIRDFDDPDDDDDDE